MAAAGLRVWLRRPGEWPGLLGGRAWLLAYALAVETALQFLLKAWSEAVEVALFAGIVGAFLGMTLAAGGPRGLWRQLTGTWTLRLAAVFLLAVGISFLWGDHSLRSVLAWLRLPTYLAMVAMVAAALEEERRLPAFAWTVLGGIAAVFALILVEFYFGSDVVGLECADVERCVTQKLEGWHWEGLLRREDRGDGFGTYGGTLNASVIAEAYGLNRLGLFGLLGSALGFGLMLSGRRRWVKVGAGALAALIIFGVIIGGSRSGLLGVGLAFAGLAILSGLTLRGRLLVPLLVSGAGVAAGVALLLWVMPYGVTTFDRIFFDAATAAERNPAAQAAEADREALRVVDTAGLRWLLRMNEWLRGEENRKGFSLDRRRIRNWGLAMELAAANPWGGEGFRTFQPEARRRFPETITAGVHSGYLKVLAETGLLGLLPYLALLGGAVWLMLRLGPGATPGMVLWRNVFLSAFAAMLLLNLVDTHSSDRYFWMTLGFVGVAEVWRRRAMAVADDDGEEDAVATGAVDGE